MAFPKKDKNQEERTAETVAAELERLAEAEQRIKARQAEITELLAAGITAEVEERERSLRSGYPAKPGNRSRELRLELEDLADQINDVARMRAHLELERLEFEATDADRRFQEAQAEVVRITPKFKEVEAELKQAKLVANNISGGRHSIRQKISCAKQNLWNPDVAYRAKEEAAIEERRQRQEEGMRRQREAQVEAFNEAAEATNPPQIRVT